MIRPGQLRQHRATIEAITDGVRGAVMRGVVSMCFAP